MRRLLGFLPHVMIVWMGFILVSCSENPASGKKESAEKLWGSERVCLPCHEFQQPIARGHNYRCDTCHRGNPWAEDKEEAHYDLIRNPQAQANISQTCDKCHRRVFGKELPYNADFIKDVVVSHKPRPAGERDWAE